MLNSVPAAIAASSRQVVLQHINAYEVIVSRKRTVRQELDGQGQPSESAATPTMGGMGVLRTEDEAEIEYVRLGEGKLMRAGPFSPMDMIERDNSLVAENAMPALIEAKAEPGTPEHFVADSGDLVMVLMGGGVVLAYEVADVAGSINIPPYTRRLILNPRDDLSYVEPFED